jgi:YVTN family beta-propeller protein
MKRVLAISINLLLCMIFVFSLNGQREIGHPPFMSPHFSPIVISQGKVFVANTPSDTIDVLDSKSGRVLRRISVGLDPISLAIRPDGHELWVSNHISDSVSVIDLDELKPTFMHVIATVQDIDPKSKATRFDEPMGIAFADERKAYVALSSENKIAVVDVATRKVIKFLPIPAQDPRGIMVRNDRLYVIPFESNNKTQLSGGYKIDGKLVTFNAHEHSIANNNILSLGHVTDIVKHPRVPDRDLFVFDVKTDKLIETVDTLGTLLYGMTADSKGTVFVAQTDARNDVNGRAGTEKHGLKELGNRAFLNQVTRVRFEQGKAVKPEYFNLEPLPPVDPTEGMALATPFAMTLSGDDSTLFVTAAGSDKVFSMDANSGEVLSRVGVEAVPRGITLEQDTLGKASKAWVLNAVQNSVSVVDVSNPTDLRLIQTIPLEDPTHPEFKAGRIAFNNADFSSTKSFSCASCHPDGHTDQLLWVLETPIVSGGNQIMPRSTMPVRGLRDTAPFHWDGIPGDPYGGTNSASVRKAVKPNIDLQDPVSAPRHLVDGSMATTMKKYGDKSVNNEGKAGLMSSTERETLSRFLLGVTYPPALRRAYDNKLSARAEEGFELFHILGDNDPTKNKPNVCGDCHRMPFLVSTNTPGSGMETPTWRGAYDRFLILPQGRLNIIDFPFYRRVAEEGIPEREMWRFSWGGRSRFDPVWEMVLEGSTGFSGSLGRQVTINSANTEDALSNDLLDALELSSSEGAIVLQVEGLIFEEGDARSIILQYDSSLNGGSYIETAGQRKAFTHDRLFQLANANQFVGTFTGRHGKNADFENPQPGIWAEGPIEKQRGAQKFPVLSKQNKTMVVSGRHLKEGASVIVNGRKAKGSVRLGDNERVEIELANLPPEGMHFVQLQNREGLFTNDFIFHVSDKKAEPSQLRGKLEIAIFTGNLPELKQLVKSGADLNALSKDGGSPLSSAAFHGRLEHVRFLLQKGADATKRNRDGGTPLHVAALMGRFEIAKLLLSKGGDANVRNKKGESSIDAVSGEWSDGVAGFYAFLNGLTSNKVDLQEIRKTRPHMVKLLKRGPKATLPL